MNLTAFILRPMQLSDIEAGMKLSSAEGWNQTEKDWRLLIGNPENICMLAEYDKKIIGTTAAINYSNQVAWICMVLVDREYRGHGVSKLLLNNILKKLEACKSVKLDATPEGQRVYKNFDFKDEYLIARMTSAPMKSVPFHDVDILPEPVEEKHIQEIVTLDKFIFGANRIQLIKTLINEFPGKAWQLKRNKMITGFALGRNGRKFHQIGPVVASNTSDAKILIMQALKALINQPVVVDVLCEKEALLNWLIPIGFAKQRNFVRMYKHENPFPGVIDKQYLICGPEFG
jgi:GNAT superfamily N-acetyltransferase